MHALIHNKQDSMKGVVLQSMAKERSNHLSAVPKNESQKCLDKYQEQRKEVNIQKWPIDSTIDWEFGAHIQWPPSPGGTNSTYSLLVKSTTTIELIAPPSCSRLVGTTGRRSRDFGVVSTSLSISVWMLWCKVCCCSAAAKLLISVEIQLNSLLCLVKQVYYEAMLSQC